METKYQLNMQQLSYLKKNLASQKLTTDIRSKHLIPNPNYHGQDQGIGRLIQHSEIYSIETKLQLLSLKFESKNKFTLYQLRKVFIERQYFYLFTDRVSESLYCFQMVVVANANFENFSIGEHVLPHSEPYAKFSFFFFVFLSFCVFLCGGVWAKNVGI